MSNINKYRSHTLTALCAAVILLSLSPCFASAIPTAENIQNLAEKAEQVWDTFIRSSFKLRIRYEYKGEFLTEDNRIAFYNLAKKAGDDLQQIVESQLLLKQRIEEYQGDDWDDRFGSSELWIRLSGHLHQTRISKFESDFYFALACKQPQKDEILKQILVQLDVLQDTIDSAYQQLLKARVLAELAKTDSTYKPLAKEEFDILEERSDMENSAAFKTATERIKLLGQTEPNELNILVESLSKSQCSNDPELVLPLLFLLRRHDTTAFEKAVTLWPQTETILSELVLEDLCHQDKLGRFSEKQLQQVATFDIELAALAAWKDETIGCEQLLGKVCENRKFQTPLILYVTAVKLAESSPQTAAELLVKASKLQKTNQSTKLEISASQIAAQATQLAYNAFTQDQSNCETVDGVFENYHNLADDYFDGQIEYLYSVILNNCGRVEEAKKLLEKIAELPEGQWRNRARLELIKQDKQQRDRILSQLQELIAETTATHDNQIHTEVLAIYCRLLLDSADKNNGQKVLNILSDGEVADDPNLNVFKSEALRRLGRINESVDCMLLTVGPENGYSVNCKHCAEGTELLGKIIDDIDNTKEPIDDFDKLLKNCEKLARLCFDCLEGPEKQQAGLCLAEVGIIAAANGSGDLLEVEKLLYDIEQKSSADANLLRCRARLLTVQKKFSQAVAFWTKVADIQKETTTANQRSWKWWRAKYYELYCSAQISLEKTKRVLHTIDVLEKSFSDIPQIWAEKLDILKENLKSKISK